MNIIKHIAICLMGYFAYLIYVAINQIIKKIFFKNKKYGKEIPHIYPKTLLGNIPIIGIIFEIGKDPVNFMIESRKKYGDIFSLNIFGQKTCVLTNLDIANSSKEFFKSTEDKLSMYEILDELFFAKAFTNKYGLDNIIHISRHAASTNVKKFHDKIFDEGKKMIDKLRKMIEESKETNKKINMNLLLSDYVMRISARCFIGCELDDEFYHLMHIFSNRFNNVIYIAQLIPRWVLKIICIFYLKSLRSKIIHHMKNEVKKYYDDETYSESESIRHAVDFKKYKNALKIDEVCGVLMCLLYVSSENTSNTMVNLLSDLCDSSGINEKYWNEIRTSSKKLLNNDEISELYKHKLIHACLSETARTTTHFMPIMRKVKNITTIGGYDVTDCKIIGICSTLVMFDKENYENPEKYYPERFMKKNGETQKRMIAWSRGLHKCPGMIFARSEIVLTIGLLSATFEKINIERQKKNYESPSAMSSKKMILTHSDFVFSD